MNDTKAEGILNEQTPGDQDAKTQDAKTQIDPTKITALIGLELKGVTSQKVSVPIGTRWMSIIKKHGGIFLLGAANPTLKEITKTIEMYPVGAEIGHFDDLTFISTVTYNDEKGVALVFERKGAL